MLTSGCRWALLLVAAALTLNASCSPPTPSAEQSATSPPPPPPDSNIPVGGKATAPPPPVATVTTAEADAVTAEIQNAVTANDSAAFAAQFDFAALVGAVMSGIEGNNLEARQIRAGLEKQVEIVRTGLIAQIFQQVQAGGSYQFLRTVQRDEGPRLLFRLRTAPGAINYHELILATRPEGARVVDMFVYASGERITETMQRILLTALPPDKQTLLATLSGSAKASIAKILPIKDMTDAQKAGDYQRVLTIYDSLDPAVRKDKGIQIMRILAAQKGDPAGYVAAIDEFRSAFPHDASIDLISLDSHLLGKRFDEFHTALNRLDKQLGGDPYLQFMRANAFIMDGKLDQAEQVAQQILATDPRNLDAHWILVSRSLSAKDFETTAAILTKIRDELGIPLADVTQIPEYAGFAASPAYKKWRAAK